MRCQHCKMDGSAREVCDRCEELMSVRHELQRSRAEIERREGELDWLYEHHADIVTDYRSEGEVVYWISGSGDLDSYTDKREAVRKAREKEAARGEGE